MLDVHTPHNPVHSWQEFLIHVAVISVGLLNKITVLQYIQQHPGTPEEQLPPPATGAAAK